MILVLIFLFLFPVDGFSEKMPPKMARANVLTGEMDNAGRGMDYSSVLTAQHTVVVIPDQFSELGIEELKYSNGQVLRRPELEIKDILDEVHKETLKETLIDRKKKLDTIESISGVNWGETIKELQDEITDLKKEINK